MFGWLKNAVLVIVLIAVIILSFWVSFMIGKRMISPVKKIPTSKTMVQGGSHAILPPEINLEVQGITFEAAEKTGAVKNKAAEKLPVTISEKKPEKEKVPEKAIAKKVEAGKTEKRITGGYVVQVGAFSRKQNAESLVAELNQKGFEASIVRSRKLYKVNAGKYDDLNAAKEQSKKINDSGYEGIIRPYGPNGRDD